MSGMRENIRFLYVVLVALACARIAKEFNVLGPSFDTMRADLPKNFRGSDSIIVRNNIIEGDFRDERDFRDGKEEGVRSDGNDVSKKREGIDSVALSRNGAVEGGFHDDRPWLIIHVGPRKTATSTIQAGLHANAARLAGDDDLYYLGIRSKDINRSKKPNIINTTDGKTVTIYRMAHIENYDFFSKVLEEHQKLGKDVILSMEQFSNWYIPWDRYWKHCFKLFFRHREPNRIRSAYTRDYQQIDNFTDSEEPLFQFRVKIVVTYRHFFEWLPSLFHESFSYLQNKFDPTLRIPGIVDFTEHWLDRLEQYDPETNSTTIYTSPKTLKVQDQLDQKKNTSTSHGSVTAFLKWSSQPELYDRVDIFDLHQQPIASRIRSQGGDSENNEAPNDVFTNFVCQMVPTASKTCRQLMENTTSVIHKRSRSPKDILSLPENDICRIKNRARRMPHLNSTELYVHKGSLHWRLIGWFQQQEDKKKIGLKQCLDSEYTSRLKVASWNSLLQMVLLSRSHTVSRKRRDEAYYSSLFQSPTTTDHLLLSSQYKHGDSNDDSWLLPTKVAHDESFDKFVGKGKFCQLDIDTLMKDEDFIRHVFAPGPTGKSNKDTSSHQEASTNSGHS